MRVKRLCIRARSARARCSARSTAMSRATPSSSSPGSRRSRTTARRRARRGFIAAANRRVMYNRASADLRGNPWSERKRWIWWDPTFVNPPDPKTGIAPPRGKWVGYDVPDFGATKAPDAKPKPDGIGLDALSGTDAFIMKGDGRGWLYAPSGLVDGPFPTHYEP